MLGRPADLPQRFGRSTADRLVGVAEQPRERVGGVGRRAPGPAERGRRLTAHRREFVPQRPVQGRDRDGGRVQLVAGGLAPPEEGPPPAAAARHAHEPRPFGHRPARGDRPERFRRAQPDQVARIANQFRELRRRFAGAQVPERPGGDGADVLVRVAQVPDQRGHRGRPDCGQDDGQLVPLLLGERRHLPQG